MRALVTGGTGFIGSQLVERLNARGDDVVCIARDQMFASSLAPLDVEIILGDLNNGIPWELLLPDVDVIYHVAGVTRSKRTLDYYNGNWLATQRLLEQCLRHGKKIKRFVYVSSQTASGPSPDGKPIREDAPYHPVSHYGKSKMLAELEVRKVEDRLPITIIRPSAVYGPRDREWFDYFKLIIRGIQPLIGLREKYMSLIHSEDLVDGIIRAADNPAAAGKIYFLANETYYSVKQIGLAMCMAVKSRPLCVRIPHCVVYLIGVLGEAIGKIKHQDVLFNIQKVRESIQPAWICSVEKAERELGFRQHFGIIEGMEDTYRWYKANGWL